MHGGAVHYDVVVGGSGELVVFELRRNVGGEGAGGIVVNALKKSKPATREARTCSHRYPRRGM